MGATESDTPWEVGLKKCRWGLFFLLSLLSLLLVLSQAKVKSTPSPRSKTGV